MLVMTSAPIQGSVWCRPRSLVWWDEVNSGRYGKAWWKENLRMSRDTFEVLCRELKPHIKKQTTYMRMPVNIEKELL